MTTSSAIVLDRLTKRFLARQTDGGRATEIVAVDAISLEIGRGELLGLLGPNGAGKTTTLLMLSTLLAPTSGTAVVDGCDIGRASAEVRRRIGVVLTGARGAYERLTARENLDYFGALYGVPATGRAVRARELLEMVGLAERGDDLVSRYSTGMRVRLALAKALMHDPPVLLLDEPTLGLDPHGMHRVREIVAGLHRAGKTIILATHDMVEADRLCQRVAVIDRGRIVAVDTPDRLKRAVAVTADEVPTLEDVFMRVTQRPLREPEEMLGSVSEPRTN